MDQLLKKIMTKKHTSNLNDQDKLKVICDDLCDNIEELLTALDLDYSYSSKMVTLACPIHNGDNLSAVNIYHTGDSYRGNWKCRTHGCDKAFKGSIIGFIRGVLSSKKYNWVKEGDQMASFEEAVRFSLDFLNKNFQDIKISKTDKEKKQFATVIEYVLDRKNNKEQNKNTINLPSRHIVRSSLVRPCQYFINRGFSTEILDKYDVGVCDKPNKEMYNRAVAPIYNIEHTHMIGCTGRSVFEKCIECKYFHDPVNSCPKNEDLWKYSKWKHSSSVSINHHLYNFWYAKKHIVESSMAILVESPGNVWKLEEHQIYNSLALFGSSISDRQKILLDSSGAMIIVILTDNDDAGNKAAEQIKIKCQNTYRVFHLKISKNDVAEMTGDEIIKEINTPIEKII